MTNVECPGCEGGMPFERAAKGRLCETCEWTERNLADRAHARTTDPETSHAAAASLDPETLRNSQQEVLELFRELGPMPDHELVPIARERGSSQSPSGLRTRRSELVDAGLLEDTGFRVTTPSNREATVWGPA